MHRSSALACPIPVLPEAWHLQQRHQRAERPQHWASLPSPLPTVRSCCTAHKEPAVLCLMSLHAEPALHGP